MHSINKAKNRFSAESAFSLVEVTLALGLFAVAILSLEGMLPLCVQSAKQSVDLTRQTAILNYIATNLEQVGFSHLSPSSQLKWTFDFDGSPTSSANQIHYTVTGTVQAGTQLPGISDTTSDLLTVKLTIAYPGGGSKTSLTVANMGD